MRFALSVSASLPELSAVRVSEKRWSRSEDNVDCTRLILCEGRSVNGGECSIYSYRPIEFHQQMRTGCQLELLKRDRGVECILLRHEQGVLRGFLGPFCQLDISKCGDVMRQTAPTVTVFT
jgi:hypothetical protein